MISRHGFGADRAKNAKIDEPPEFRKPAAIIRNNGFLCRSPCSSSIRQAKLERLRAAGTRKIGPAGFACHARRLLAGPQHLVRRVRVREKGAVVGIGSDDASWDV